MSKKDETYPPTQKQVKELVEGLGGAATVAGILGRNRSTIWRWVEGKTKIPMVDWKLLLFEKEAYEKNNA